MIQTMWDRKRPQVCYRSSLCPFYLNRPEWRWPSSFFLGGGRGTAEKYSVESVFFFPPV